MTTAGTDIHHTPTAAPGQDYRVVLELRNTGFAAPMNPRAVELVFVDGKGKKMVHALGDCVICLNLPDPEVALRNNPLFSIRLANAEYMWDEKNGYNRLISLKL